MALPTIVFKKIRRNRTTRKSIAMGQLIIGALFFGMRSCEYVTIKGKKRRTKKLLIKDIRFFCHRSETRKVLSNREALLKATSVSITFSLQKNNKKYATISQQRNNTEIFPVTAWAEVILRILSYDGTNELSPVDLFWNQENILTNLTADDIAQHLKSTCRVIGSKILGFLSDRVGTHSNRSSFAMLLLLQGVPPSVIMLQGCWKSKAFMNYLCTQIQQFSNGLSTSMVDKDFFSIPDIASL